MKQSFIFVSAGLGITGIVALNSWRLSQRDIDTSLSGTSADSLVVVSIGMIAFMPIVWLGVLAATKIKQIQSAPWIAMAVSIVGTMMIGLNANIIAGSSWPNIIAIGIGILIALLSGLERATLNSRLQKTFEAWIQRQINPPQ